MPAVLALVWGVLLGWGSGGSLAGLERTDIRFPYAVLATFLLQGLVRGRIGTAGSELWGVLVWALLSVALVALLALQSKNAMLTIVALGVSANVLVVLLNGYMPVFPVGGSAAAVVAGGFYGLGSGATIAPFLADCLPLPLLGHTYMLSLGDLLLVAGASGFIVYGMRRNSAH